jgi:hypothetical protein
MISLARFFGGAQSQTLPAPGSPTLDPLFARLWRLRAGAGSMWVVLPNPTSTARADWVGKGALVVENIGGTHTFDIKDHNGSVVYTLPIGEAVEINLGSSNVRASSTASADYVWVFRPRLVL